MSIMDTGKRDTRSGAGREGGGAAEAVRAEVAPGEGKECGAADAGRGERERRVMRHRPAPGPEMARRPAKMHLRANCWRTTSLRG